MTYPTIIIISGEGEEGTITAYHGKDGVYSEIDGDDMRSIDLDDIDDISSAASLLGRKGGQAKSERKTAAVRENGKKGGRTAMEMKTWCVLNNENGAFFGTVDAKTWKKALTLAYDVYSRDRRFTLDVIGDAEYREKLGLSRP